MAEKPLTSIVISIVLGFVVGPWFSLWRGYNPLRAPCRHVSGHLSKPKYAMAQVVIKSTPLYPHRPVGGVRALKPASSTLGQRGQYIIGSVAPFWLALSWSLPPVLHFWRWFTAAMVAAGLWGALPASSRLNSASTRSSPASCSNWIALYFNNFAIQMPWLKKPGAEASYEVQRSAWSMVLGNYKATEEGGRLFWPIPPWRMWC